ncbi:MAG: leucine-rich repeat protein, partial [Lachnospiraceae bacterium]|nr:leucine-rich repeat protein [Lachnospiraceae bacterium]
GEMTDYYDIDKRPWHSKQLSIKTVEIKEGVTYVGLRAFKDCENLQTVVLPKSVKEISLFAFFSCRSLKSVNIPAGVTALHWGVFAACSSLTSITIPEGVTTLEGHALSGCNSLTSVTIPATVTTIGKNAFDDDDNLKDVYYGGDQKAWNAIKMDEGNVNLRSAKIHYKSSFTDVPSDSPFADAIEWAREKGITGGINATTFGINQNCTRGQAVTFMFRAEARSFIPRRISFTDVKEGSFCYKAVQWAVGNGITKGITSTEFRPDDVCTRGQIVTFLYRYYGTR